MYEIKLLQGKIKDFNLHLSEYRLAYSSLKSAGQYMGVDEEYYFCGVVYLNGQRYRILFPYHDLSQEPNVPQYAIDIIWSGLIVEALAQDFPYEEEIK